MVNFKDIAGAASATLGILQYGMGGLIAPIVGIGQGETALPMALVILVSAMSLAAIAVSKQRILASPVRAETDRSGGLRSDLQILPDRCDRTRLSSNFDLGVYRLVQ